MSTSSTLTSLGSLLNQALESDLVEDDEDWDIDEVDEFLAQLSGADLQDQDADMDISMDQVNRILGSTMQQLGRMPERYEFPATFVGSGKRVFPLVPSFKGPLSVRDGFIYAGSTAIGKSNVSLNLNIEKKDWFSLTDLYTEQVGGKGTGLGFSVFVHAMACLMLVGNGTIEPYSGHDMEIDGVTFEVTGMNWAQRRTTANVVINKYALVQLFDTSQHNAVVIKRSHDEDKGICDSLLGSAIDQGPSPYSEYVRRLSALITYTTDDQIDKIKNQLLHYLSTQPIPTPLPRTDFNSDKLKLNIDKGGKMLFGELKYPAPFRVLCPLNMSYDAPIDEILNLIRFGWQEGTSTFHTRSRNDDPEALVWDFFPNRPNAFNTRCESVTDAQYVKYSHYGVVQSMHIEAELLTKISGKFGNYYSIHSNVGVIWQKATASSLTVLVQYYTLSQPQDVKYIGQWSQHNEPILHFKSPTFKVSNQDLHFYSCLPGVALTLINTCRSLCTSNDQDFILSKVGVVLSMFLHSSWQTTVYSANQRYITLCHMAQSGDMQMLIDKVTNVSKNIKSCDFIYLRLLEKYCNNHSPHDVTPLLKLPVRFASLEKDLHLGCQWHIRGEEHNDRCMIKIVENFLDEKLTRDTDVVFLKKQIDFFERMQETGVPQCDFDTLMRECPEHPTLNSVMFVGLASLAQPSLEKIGTDQTNTGFSLWRMISDRHSNTMDWEKKTLTHSKVYEEAIKIIKKHQPSGPYDLLLKMGEEEVIYLFGMHAKDSKDADRDISVMDFTMRIFQYYKESLTVQFNNNVDNDMMNDPSKYETFVSSSTRLMKEGRTIMASEDRTNFCGLMHPEKMALCTQIVARISGSTSLTGAAAMQLLNTKRKIVFPSGTTHILEGMNPIIRIHGREITTSFFVDMFRHMMQGIEARGAGLINTIYVLGMCAALGQLFEGFGESVAFTTSDDVFRAMRVLNAELDMTVMTSIFIFFFNTFLGNCMMKNNVVKGIASTNLGEFNNVAVTPDGMVPQSPIQSALAVKPLMSNSIIGDVIDSVSMARVTILWGDPPEQAEAALYSYLKIIRTKWLLKDEDVDLIISSGLWPRSMSELLEGFFPRDIRTFSTLVSLMEPEDRLDFENGDVPVTKALYQISVPTKKRKRYKKPEGLPPQLTNAKVVADSIVSARNLASRLNPKYLPMPSWKKRLAVRNKFNNIFENSNVALLHELYNRMCPLTVTTQVIRATRRLTNPQSIGSSTSIALPDKKVINAKRLFNMNYRRAPSEEEARIAGLPDIEYIEAIKDINLQEVRLGQSKRVPGGLAFTRGFDGKFYKRPMMFNFSVDLPVIAPPVGRMLESKGVIFQNVKPIYWGGTSLMHSNTTKDSRIAFAIGEYLGCTYALYQLSGKNNTVQHFKMDLNSGDTMQYTTVNNVRIYAMLRKDYSPFECSRITTMTKYIGDCFAILNYGSYIFSSSIGGFAVLQKIFFQRKSVFPPGYREILPSYPHFPDSAVKIPSGRVVKFLGYRSSRRVDLSVSDPSIPIVTVDCQFDIAFVSNSAPALLELED